MDCLACQAGSVLGFNEMSLSGQTPGFCPFSNPVSREQNRVSALRMHACCLCRGNTNLLSMPADLHLCLHGLRSGRRTAATECLKCAQRM